jgi:flagellar biosynthesis protein FlhF
MSRRSPRRQQVRIMGRLELKSVAARSAMRAGLSPSLAADDARALLGDALRAHDTPAPLADRLVQLAVAQMPTVRLIERLAAALAGTIGFPPLDDILNQPTVFLLGPEGAGKTTLAAKLAVRFGERDVMVVSTEPSDRATLQPIEEYTSVLGIPLTVASDAQSLKHIIAGAAGRRVIIDPAGLSLDDATSRARLKALLAAAGAEPLLVIPAETPAKSAAVLGRAAAELGARSFIATRLDLARRLGGMLAAADAGPLALVGTSITPHFAFGLRPLSPEVLARRLLTSAAEDTRREGSVA